MGLSVLLPLIRVYREWDTQNAASYFKRIVFLQELSRSQGRPVLLQPLFFMLRRILLAVAVVWICNVVAIQFLIVTMSAVAGVILIGNIKPFNESNKNRDEQANEVFLLVLIYHFLCFTPLLPDAKIQSYLGFSFISLEILFIAACLLRVAHS